MEVLVQPLDRVLQVQPGANLLEVLREHQIPISYSCMSGRCGTCRCKLIEGEVLDSGQEMQRPFDGEAQFVHACQTVLTQPCIIEIPEPDEVVVHPARIIKSTVSCIEDLTHDIKRLRLRPAKPLSFSPGQYASLQFAPDLIRPYSMAGLPTDDELEFHVRLVPNGRVTGHIAGVLREGDAVRVSGPLGSAHLRRKHEGPMLCVAGGTGLAPILSILRGAIEGGMDNPMHLYVGVRAARDIYGLDALHALQARHAGLHVHVVVSSGDTAIQRSAAALTSDSASITQRRGLVTEAIAQDWPSLDGWRAYLCGSPPMVEATSLLVKQRGLSAERIYADAFYASPT